MGLAGWGAAWLARLVRPVGMDGLGTGGCRGRWGEAGARMVSWLSTLHEELARPRQSIRSPGPSRDPLIHPDRRNRIPEPENSSDSEIGRRPISRQLPSSPNRAKPSTRLKKRNEKKGHLPPGEPVSAGSRQPRRPAPGRRRCRPGRWGCRGHTGRLARASCSLPSTGGSGKKKMR